MTGALYRLAKFSVRHRRAVLVVWLIVTVAAVVVSHRLGDTTSDSLSLPGTDSQRATDALEHAFPDQANGSSPIVIHAPRGTLTEPKNAEAVNAAAASVAKAPHVAGSSTRSPPPGPPP